MSRLILLAKLMVGDDGIEPQPALRAYITQEAVRSAFSADNKKAAEAAFFNGGR
jgi:hypothetical protein